jgi:CHAT domain-containing protein/tetratricopeptide (TPR) repeat protein
MRWLCGLLAITVCLAPIRAQGKLDPDTADAYRRAGEEYDAGHWLEAAALYRRAAEGADDYRRSVCYERLLYIHARLGRLDQAVRYGLRCRELVLQLAARGAGRERLAGLDLQLGECYLHLGHYRDAERHLASVLSPAAGVDPLPPIPKLTALMDLACSAERRGDRAAALRHWGQVERTARELLRAPLADLTAAERIGCTWKLADSYQFQERPDPAIARLEPLLAIHDRLENWPGKRDTLRRLAAHYTLRGDHARAAACLEEALDLHGKAATPEDRLLRGELAEELSDCLARLHRTDEAERWRKQAAESYGAILRGSGGQSAQALAVHAFWKLEKLYQKTSQYPQALRLAEDQAARWTGSLLCDSRLKSEMGALRELRGLRTDARGLLRAAVAEMEAQSPLNLIDLPRALDTLAGVEHATGELDRAEELARRCLDLYRRYELPEDVVAADANNVLGTCAAECGRNAVAVDRYREGLHLCVKLGPSSDVVHGDLLLNLALVHKSQGEYGEALRLCQEARAIYRRLPGADARGLAAFDAAVAGLYATLGQLEDAYALTPTILDVCRRFEIVGGPLLVTALHCQGLYHLARRDFAAAEQAWEQVRRVQENEKHSLLLPRTLNYQALAAELEGKLDKAEVLYGQARELQRQNRRAFPATHFITLWRLGGMAERLGRRAEARALLEEAIGVVEVARLQTYGAAEQRAGYFAQFAPGFERLVECCLRHGDVEGALAAAARSRSRTLLDQLQLAGVDPRASLQGEHGRELCRREEELSRKINGLRARAGLLPLEAIDAEEGKALMASLDEAQQAYTQLWREILNDSPLYRNLSAELSPATFLAGLRRALPPRTLMLVYHLGRERSHLLLIGDGAVRAEAFPLRVPAEVAANIGSPFAGTSAASAGCLRGLRIHKQQPQPEEPEVAAAGAAVPLTLSVARALVDHYRLALEDAEFRPTRGLRLTPRRPEQEMKPQRIELLSEILLPAEARRRIHAAAGEELIVVPDGPLHKLPLEALVIEGGRRPRFVLDELPPIVYVPSAAILPLLVERPRPSAGSPLSLLTVCNPAYPQEKTAAPPQAASRGVLGLAGQLPPLPSTAQESRRIRAQFDPAQVKVLEGLAATEGAVTAAVAGKRFLHLAAHGFADDRFGNLFGAVALTPPAAGRAPADEDGFLSLYEIYRLPLGDCDLAVLSACVTNVGPQQPLEAGVTLASGFLAAGARRVVASHWSVDDEATAVLMEAFFKEVTDAARRGERISFARNLHKARLAVRDRAEWSAPFFWAPFVLLGSPD